MNATDEFSGERAWIECVCTLYRREQEAGRWKCAIIGAIRDNTIVNCQRTYPMRALSTKPTAQREDAAPLGQAGVAHRLRRALR